LGQLHSISEEILGADASASSQWSGIDNYELAGHLEVHGERVQVVQSESWT
jgi:hypothetical protein